MEAKQLTLQDAIRGTPMQGKRIAGKPETGGLPRPIIEREPEQNNLPVHFQKNIESGSQLANKNCRNHSTQ